MFMRMRVWLRMRVTSAWATPGSSASLSLWVAADSRALGRSVLAAGYYCSALDIGSHSC